jgi:hypothetical protein
VDFALSVIGMKTPSRWRLAIEKRSLAIQTFENQKFIARLQRDHS